MFRTSFVNIFLTVFFRLRTWYNNIINILYEVGVSLMKKLTAAVLAAVLSVGCTTTAFANDAIKEAIELNQYNFEEKESVSGRFLNLLASYPDESAIWQTEDFAFTFHSNDVPEGLDDRTSIQLHMERIKDRLSIYNKAVGRDTPKYVFKTEAETFKVPFEMTIRDSSFMPGSTVHVYRLDSTTWDQGTQTNVFSAIKKDVLVAENGDITFPMAEGGTYLVSAKPVISHEGELEEMLFQVKYEQRGNYDELLTYLKDDPNGYFTNLWEAPGHIAAEDEE